MMCNTQTDGNMNTVKRSSAVIKKIYPLYQNAACPVKLKKQNWL